MLLAESAGAGPTFQVGFDVWDYRMMGWYRGRLPYEPVDYIAYRFTFDPAMVELVDWQLGPDCGGSWYWVVYAEPAYEDTTRTKVMVSMNCWDDADALTYPAVFPPVPVDGWPSYHIFRPAIFTFRQVAQQGTTAIIPEKRVCFPWPSYNGVGDNLNLRLTPDGPRLEASVLP